MDEILQEIRLSGFDPTGEPVIRIMADRLYVVFNGEPPPFADFDKQLEQAIGVPVVWDDREVFVIYQARTDTIERIRRFIENYWSNVGTHVGRWSKSEVWRLISESLWLAPILCTRRCESRFNRYRCVLGLAERSGVGPRTHLPELRRCQIPQRTVRPFVVVRPLPILAYHTRLQLAPELLGMFINSSRTLLLERLGVAVSPGRALGSMYNTSRPAFPTHDRIARAR